jgi:hypothetical protein
MKYRPLIKPCLKWETNFGDYGFLVENHLARLASHFQNLFDRPNYLNTEIKGAWKSLDQTSRIQLLVNPDAAEIILAAIEKPFMAFESSLKLQLEDLMAAVLIESGHQYSHPRSLPWAKRPTLFTTNGLRVDAEGMLHNLSHPNIVAPSAEQTNFYLVQVNKAMEVIAEVSTEALSLIENFTTTIHFRENPNHPNFCSWSTHIGVGKITASNFGDVASDLAEVIDFLIHESIHNFLHLVEEQYGPFLEEAAYSLPWIKEKIVPSPWSGKKIDLGSYTHAISVWYGLACFWLKAQDYAGRHAHELGPKRIEQMIAQASQGFIKRENVHLAAGERFSFMNKDFLSFSLGFQTEISQIRSESALA